MMQVFLKINFTDIKKSCLIDKQDFSLSVFSQQKTKKTSVKEALQLAPNASFTTQKLVCLKMPV